MRPSKRITQSSRGRQIPPRNLMGAWRGRKFSNEGGESRIVLVANRIAQTRRNGQTMTDNSSASDARTYEQGIDDAAAIVMRRYAEVQNRSLAAGVMDGLILGQVTSALACTRSEIIALKEREG